MQVWLILHCKDLRTEAERRIVISKRKKLMLVNFYPTGLVLWLSYFLLQTVSAISLAAFETIEYYRNQCIVLRYLIDVFILNQYCILHSV